MERFQQILRDTASVLASGARHLLRRRTCTEVFRQDAPPLSPHAQRIAPRPDPCLDLLLKDNDACIAPNHAVPQLHSNDESPVFLSDVSRPSSSRILLRPVGEWRFWVTPFDPQTQVFERKGVCYIILPMSRGRGGGDIRVVVSYEGEPNDFQIEFMRKDRELTAADEMINTCEHGAAVLTFQIVAVKIWIVAVTPETCARYLGQRH